MMTRAVVAFAVSFSLAPLSLRASDEKALLTELRPAELERHAREIVRHVRDGTRLNGDRVRFAQELGATCDSQMTCATRCGKFVQRSASLTGAFTSYLPFAPPSITQI